LCENYYTAVHLSRTCKVKKIKIVTLLASGGKSLNRGAHGNGGAQISRRPDSLRQSKQSLNRGMPDM
jgi:hypothetical protein